MQKEKISVKKKYIFDIILIASLLAVGLLSLLIATLNKEKGDLVKITVNGEEYAVYELNTDEVYKIGDGNELTVSGGAAYMSHADCPDGTCVRTGKIENVGEKIVCLPHKVMVEIVGWENEHS